MMIVKSKKMLKAFVLLSVVLGLAAFSALYFWDQTVKTKDETPPASAGQYGVSAGNPLAVSVGMKILEDGGSAVDAAVAVAYTLGVVQPYGSGIGGGGAMLIYPTDGKPPVFYDYQGVSPANGQVPEGYVAVPGFVLAMETINEDLGTFPMNQLIAPSIDYAKNGFVVDATLDKILHLSKSKLEIVQSSVFYNNGAQPGTGILLTQPELALTLSLIQKKGSNAFYRGELADKIVAAVPGLEASDLSSYKVSASAPVTAKYGKYDIFSAPPPFGGVTLIQILKMAEQLKVENLTTDAKDLYTMSRIISTAYSKRLKTIADPKFYEMDSQNMVSPPYIDLMVQDINKTLSFTSFDNEDTTHFVIIDKDGMMVSCTNSLSSWFGSGISTGGFFLNNHLKNFSQDPGNLNRLEGGKRPRTFMSPTIISLNGKPVLGIGTPGGNRIPAVLSQVLINMLINGEDPQVAIDEPRFYVRGSVFYYEKVLPGSLAQELKNNGISTIHDTSPLNFGAVNCLYLDPFTSKILGGADQRRGGAWAAKYLEKR